MKHGVDLADATFEQIAYELRSRPVEFGLCIYETTSFATSSLCAYSGTPQQGITIFTQAADLVKHTALNNGQT